MSQTTDAVAGFQQSAKQGGMDKCLHLLVLTEQLQEDAYLRHCPLDSSSISRESPIIIFFFLLFNTLISPEYALISNLHSSEILPLAVWKDIHARGHNTLLT